ncbi:SPOR domain-containing protein [Methylomagnum sp.]
MSRDYKNRIPAYRQHKPNHTRLWSMLGAAVAGVAGLAALAYYSFFRPEGQIATPPAGPETVQAVPANTAAVTPLAKPGDGKKPTANGKKAEPAPAPAIPEPRFSFYKILSEKEVIIPENEIKTMKREEEAQGKKPETTYLLQAGSFTSQADAERLRAHLAEIKVKAKLEMIKLDNTAWFRVKVGPYATLADADKVRQHLRSNKIDSVVQKATK